MRGIRESSNSETSSRSSGLRQFSLTSFREAQRIVVRACGRLIVGRGADQDLWAAHVDETTATNVALDLSCVNDVDARGLGLIAGLVNRARGRGTIVSVMAASRVVQRLAEMTMIRASCGQAWLAALDDFRNWLIRAERV
jgi:anti-anti-sigma regulatory factor